MDYAEIVGVVLLIFTLGTLILRMIQDGEDALEAEKEYADRECGWMLANSVRTMVYERPMPDTDRPEERIPKCSYCGTRNSNRKENCEKCGAPLS